MTDRLLALVPEHGVLVLFVATFLSCLAVPIPSSLLMLAAGAFVASGDLAALPVAAAALGGAVLGDQLGYGIGHSGGISLWTRLLAGRKSGPPARRAAQELHRRAGMTVYFSRWLFSALGPWVNFAAGATRIAAFFAGQPAGGNHLGRAVHRSWHCLRRTAGRNRGHRRIGHRRAGGRAGGRASGPRPVAAATQTHLNCCTLDATMQTTEGDRRCQTRPAGTRF